MRLTVQEENYDVKGLENAINSYSPNMSPDTWRCELGSDGNYKVNTLRRMLDTSSSPEASAFVWPKEIPPKIICFAWRARLGRIPSATALQHRGIIVNSTTCSYCGNQAAENSDHILATCPFARNTLGGILNWCGLPHIDFSSVHEITDFAAGWGNCPKKRRKLTGICYGTIWNLWKARNDRVFNNKIISPSTLVDMTKAMLFVWYKHRGKEKDLRWNNWNICPL